MGEQKPFKIDPRQLKMEKWVSSVHDYIIAKIQYKVNFLRKSNEEGIMSRSFLSYGVDFRTPWEGEILRKSRNKIRS